MGVTSNLGSKPSSRICSSMYFFLRWTMNPDCRGSTPGPLGCVMTQHFSIAATNDAGSREMTGMARGMKRREFTLPRSPRMV